MLRAIGHPRDARIVAIAKQDRLRRSGKLTRGFALLHRLYGALMGYGYRPLRLLGAAVGLWLLCALAYWGAANPAWFGAAGPLIQPTGQPSGAAAAAAYRSFEPFDQAVNHLRDYFDRLVEDGSEWTAPKP